ncbi:MFS transporter [Labrys monachus]|uniref:Metabolite-proton symporter n=1 Tax=Labrys monachus TaxID=217067 RepID=A0ABU0FKE1_9HYPH|nr:MFS transporter [Labrys monachus]MDQ0395079.1 metabolite-proton symporter [Labrys monachus]
MAGKAGGAAALRDGARTGDIGIGRIVLASLVGTTIEFYDFYIYGTAAALVIGQTFFPQSAPGSQALNAFLTFGIAFLARPIGSILFGHFGDRIGRKSTLVASMLVMGLSTTLIGLLPGYQQAGALAPWLLCILRFGQGIGLGGEWGGAALLATENAPRGRRAWFGMFPQIGPALGFFMANGLFLLLLLGMDDASFIAWGWRIPFLISAVLVAIGLYLRVSITETPAFRQAVARNERVSVPLADVLRHHWLPLIQGSLSIVVCYALFYISTVFALGYGVGTRHIPRTEFLGMLCLAVVFMAVATPIAAALADRVGTRKVLLVSSALAALFGFALPPLLGGESIFGVQLFLSMALALMGLTFAPLGALLPSLFPTHVRYTGASSAYNLGGIIGASLAPYLAQLLLERGGLPWVGYYLTAAAVISFLAVFSIGETDEV